MSASYGPTWSASAKLELEAPPAMQFKLRKTQYAASDFISISLPPTAVHSNEENDRSDPEVSTNASPTVLALPTMIMNL